MQVTFSKALEPWRIRGRHACRHHLRNMAVDIVSEEGRAVLCHLTEASVRKKSRLHEGLESVAYAENEASAVDQSMDRIRYLLVIQHIRNELAASVRFVTGRESAAEHKDMALVDILLHLGYRPEDVVLGKVAEHAHTHLGTCIAPSLCGIVIAVCTREYREICDRLLHRLALVSEVRLLRLIRLHALKTCRNHLLAVSLSGIRINLCESFRIDCHELEDVELRSVYGKLALLSVRNLSDKYCVRIVKLNLRLHEDRTVSVIEEFLLIICHLGIKTVSERHLADSLGKSAESESVSRNDILRLNLLMYILPVCLKLLDIRHMVRKRCMLDQIKPVAFIFEFRRDNLLCIDSSDTERHEHRRHIDVLECSAHRVLASDRRKAELNLHLEGTHESRKRLAP